MIEPIVRLPEVSDEELKAWPFQEDPTEDLESILLRNDSGGTNWRILYEFSCERQDYPDPSPGLHGARYEEFRFIYCVLVKTSDADKFVADLNQHQSLDVSDFNPREFTDGPFLLEAYWRDTWTSEKFAEETRGAKSSCKYSNPVANYHWESHMDKTLPGGFSVYLPERWLTKDLGISLKDDSTRSWVDTNGLEIIKTSPPIKGRSAVLIREDALLDYCAKEEVTPIWLLIGERNTWLGGMNDESCWRRSEGAWKEENGEWKHIAWNHDSKR